MDPLIFSFKQLKSLLTQRDENGSSLDNFVAELAASLRQLEPRSTKYTIQKARASPDVASKQSGIIGDILHYWRQSRKLMLILRCDRSLCIFGIDTKRLDLVKGNLPEQVAAHVSKTIPNINTWSKMSENHEVLIFDPRLEAGYRSVSYLTDQPVLSPLAIIFFALQNPKSIKDFPKTFKYGLIHLGPAYSSFYHRMVSIFLLSLFLVGVQVLVKRTNGKLSLLCLTSNSVFLEALRAWILSDPCGEVIEIQHGIPSPKFDPYFYSFRNALKSSIHGKLQIHPLLPPPFCMPPEKNIQFCTSEEPSNTGIYRSLIKAMSDAGVRPRSQIGAERIPTISKILEKNIGQYLQPGKGIFAIFGGTDLTQNFYEGSAFKAEMILAQVIYQCLRLKADIQPFYLPHPANKSLSSIEFPDGTPLTIFNQSQQMYFFADYAFALYSSSIFEAKAFGVNSFCATPAKTNLLHACMLNELICPIGTTKKDLKRAISQFAALPSPCNRNLRDKIDQRLSLFFAGAN